MSKRVVVPNVRRVEDRRSIEAVAELTGLLLEQDPDLGRAKAKKQAERLVRQAQEGNRHYVKVFLRTLPSLRFKPSQWVSTLAEIRATVTHPKVAWLMRHMAASTAGRPAVRALIVVALFKMARFNRPDFANTVKDLEGSKRYRWAFGGDLAGPGHISSRYSSLNSIVNNVKPGATIHVNLDLIDEILAMRNPKTGQVMFPDAFKRCAIDGTLIEADVPQYPPTGDSRRARKENERKIAGPVRPMVQYVWYSRNSGSAPEKGPYSAEVAVKSCFGYKLVVIVCIDTGLPVIWTLLPATGDERVAMRELLAALYRLRPQFPMEYIVGDGLYSMSKAALLEPYEMYGIHPVFPVVKGRSTDNPWVETAGVPCCAHGLMEFHKEGEFWGATKRRKEGVKPGSPPPNGKGKNPRLRWRCPVKEENAPKCPEVATYLKEDPHLNTYLPHKGNSERTALRYVLQARRNTVESLNAQLKYNGVGATWPSRNRWGKDDGMRWLVSLGLLQITAKRLVHLNGTYEKALHEAIDEGLLTKQEEETFTAKLPEPEDLPVPGFTPEPGEPSTWPVDADLPIDREYVLPSIDEYPTKPDRNRNGDVT
jgi:hypothetical protein